MKFEKTICYNIQKHEYSVELNIDDNYYFGSARCNPADYENESEFVGYGLATDRAMIDYFKSRLRTEKEEYKLLRNFVTSISQYKDFDPEAPFSKHMYRQLNIYGRKIVNTKLMIANHKRKIAQRIALTNKKEEKDNSPE